MNILWSENACTILCNSHDPYEAHPRILRTNILDSHTNLTHFEEFPPPRYPPHLRQRSELFEVLGVECKKGASRRKPIRITRSEPYWGDNPDQNWSSP